MTPPTMAPSPQNEKAESPPHIPTDQEQFDATVSRDSWIFLRVLAGIGIFTALVISVLALFEASRNHTTSMVMNAPTQTVTAPSKTAVAPTGGASTGAAAARTVSLSVVAGGKKAPNGKMYDAYTKTNFAVKAGQPLHLRINNKDDVPHSIYAPSAGVNIKVKPGTHTYTLLVKSAGKFQWVCNLPCDDWAMQHAGFMAGNITAS